MTACALCLRTPTTRALYVAHDSGPIRAMLAVDLCCACLARLLAGEAKTVTKVRKVAGVEVTDATNE